ncbi:MAG: hypothetical protein AUK63_1226 [bacterium P3]|nr:MAG: hypothetical protein AUK63_1226 [bacterium P3]KWW40502.1 MAG: hypothetical protein F083_1571 [bacterium F083]
MALLLGIEYCKIDSNGRFKFPVALKRQLETEDNRFVVRRSFDSECLELWTYASFQAEVEQLQEKLNPYNIADRAILRRMTHANQVDMDTNDRLLIPPEQKSVLGDAKEIVLQSTGKYIEIWERDAYGKMEASLADFASLVDQRLGQHGGISSTGSAE